MLFLAQDHLMFHEAEAAVAALDLAILGFVRLTCARGGSFGKDAEDSADGGCVPSTATLSCKLRKNTQLPSRSAR